MDMETDEAGTAMKPELTPPPLPPPVGGASPASSLASGSPASAKGVCSGRPNKGDEGGQDDASSDEGAGMSDDTGNSDGESSSGTGSVASGAEAEGELHPMKNPLILKTMFALCPRWLLADFRLVCTQWRDLAMESWRSSVALNFERNSRGKVGLYVGDTNQFGYHVPGHDDNATVPLKEFLNYVKAPQNQCLLKPFRRFHLEGFIFPSSRVQNAEGNKLWELVKGDVTALSLYQCTFRDVEAFREVIYKDCPKLQHLELDNCRICNPAPSLSELWVGPLAAMFFQPVAQKIPISVGVYPQNSHLKSLVIEADMKRFPLTWLELFTQFPALTRLSVIVCKSDNDDENDAFPMRELLPMLQAIQTIRKGDPRQLPLKEVVLDPHADISQKSPGIFDLILELSLPLDAFQLCLDGVTQVKLTELAGAAEMDGRPLRILTFHKTERGISTWKFPFPGPLDNLEMLIMTGGIIWENMEWLKLLPNLRRLEVTDKPPVSEEYRRSKKSLPMISTVRNRELPHTKMLKMKCFTCNYALSEEDLRQLASWFPNLTHLDMVLDDKLFPVACNQWMDLRYLKVIGAKLTDEGVTGLRAGQIVGDLDRIELPPNIGLLHYLKSFIYSRSGKLSDVSVFNGFLKLPHLRYLRLEQTNGMSKEAKTALKNKGILHLVI